VLLGLTGQKNGLAAFVLDLTQEKKVQSELREAERALREAGRRKDEFLGVLSHELRNPLAPIRNSLYLLERTPPLDERARRAVEIIGRQTAHLSRLIDDLLDVTRISSGKIRLRMARLDLVQLLSKTADDLSWVFGTAGLKLDIDLPEQPLWVDGDATRLSQIAGNLLSNASKFTPRGGTVRLAARVECHSAEAPAALIEVADTGTGIEPSMLPQMFQPFSQAERTVERSGGGLGLGLALVKGLVELHGGRVSVTSAGTGQGACFLVALPLAGPPAARAAPVRTPKGREGPRRILVVEDNRDAAESLRTALELNHHVVEVASDGPEGLSKAQQFKPDIVLCDIGLPGFDGYELARRLRALGQFRSVPLVAISGYGRPSDVRQAAEAGFQQHLTKPPDLVAVERLVETSGP
jgi:two-component system CheB/CheR fusion protein